MATSSQQDCQRQSAACLQAVRSSRESAQSWEAQAQDALLKIEQLKGLLAEGVAWQASQSEAEQPQVCPDLGLPSFALSHLRT